MQLDLEVLAKEIEDAQTLVKVGFKAQSNLFRVLLSVIDSQKKTIESLEPKKEDVKK